MNEDEEERLRDVERFVIEVRTGRRTVILVFSAIGGGLMLLAAFWGQLFGNS